jgi:hypothetical protein
MVTSGVVSMHHKQTSINKSQVGLTPRGGGPFAEKVPAIRECRSFRGFFFTAASRV